MTANPAVHGLLDIGGAWHTMLLTVAFQHRQSKPNRRDGSCIRSPGVSARIMYLDNLKTILTIKSWCTTQSGASRTSQASSMWAPIQFVQCRRGSHHVCQQRLLHVALLLHRRLSPTPTGARGSQLPPRSPHAPRCAGGHLRRVVRTRFSNLLSLLEADLTAMIHGSILTRRM